MKMLHPIPVLILLLTIVGCSGPTGGVTSRLNREAKAAGSPIRWKSEKNGGNTIITRVLLDLPRGETKADTALKQEILSKIEQVEKSKGRSTPAVEEIRLMPDDVRQHRRFSVPAHAGPRGSKELDMEIPKASEWEAMSST
jgi:hypothetical protein